MDEELIPGWFENWFQSNFKRPSTTPAHIVQIASLKKDTVYRALNSGELEAFRFGNRWSIPRPSLRNWFLENLNSE